MAAAGGREHPGLFVVETCRQFLRTVPTLPRCPRDPDDADTAAEDHVYNETRYRVTARKGLGGEKRVMGFWWVGGVGTEVSKRLRGQIKCPCFCWDDFHAL